MITFDYSGNSYTIYNTLSMSEFKRFIDKLIEQKKYIPIKGSNYSRQQLEYMINENSSYLQIDFIVQSGLYTVNESKIDFMWNLLRLWDIKYIDILDGVLDRNINISISSTSKTLEDLSNQRGYIEEQITEFRISEIAKISAYFT